MQGSRLKSNWWESQRIVVNVWLLHTVTCKERRNKSTRPIHASILTFRTERVYSISCLTQLRNVPWLFLPLKTSQYSCSTFSLPHYISLVSLTVSYFLCLRNCFTLSCMKYSDDQLTSHLISYWATTCASLIAQWNAKFWTKKSAALFQFIVSICAELSEYFAWCRSFDPSKTY